MFEPAERLKSVKVSASSAMTRKVRELRALGVKIVGLSSGEPDFKSPLHAIEAGYKAALAGDTKYPPQDGTKALKEAVQKGGPALLEPIMRVEVTVPDDFMGDIIGDLNSRRGQIQGMEARGNAQIVRAFVPLSEMFGYATDMRSMTQGRASYSMFFDHYTQVPNNIAQALMKK